MKIADNKNFDKVWSKLMRDMEAVLSLCHTDNHDQSEMNQSLRNISLGLLTISDMGMVSGIKGQLKKEKIRKAVKPDTQTEGWVQVIREGR